jgi:beta-lactam-binding protein with PASTA domain
VRKLFRFLLLSLVLLLVFLGSALLAMRFAIHGREVRVPKFTGLTQGEADRLAVTQGLLLSFDSRFYSAEVPEGRVVSQVPPAGAKVRRGLKVRVARSLGPQIAAVPNLVGQSEHAASINVSRYGHEISAAAVMHYSGAQPNTVVAQSPPPDTKKIISPKIGLVFAAPDNTQWYIMPRFTGHQLHDAAREVQQAGFTLGQVNDIPVSETKPETSGTIVWQYPQAGQRIAAGSTISFGVRK